MTGRKILQFAVRTLSPLLLGVMQNHSMGPERALQDMGGVKQISLNIYHELSLQSSPWGSKYATYKQLVKLEFTPNSQSNDTGNN